MKRYLFVLALLLAAPSARADQEASNNLRVFCAKEGATYAKSIPSSSYGDEGVTKVYQASENEDVLVYTFPWYTRHLELSHTGVGSVFVRFGPWSRGSKASKDHLAFEFYLGDKLLKSYSTLDIAGSAENVSSSVSHYSVIKEVRGFRWLDGNKHVFEVITQDGRTLRFDPDTGLEYDLEEYRRLNNDSRYEP